MGAKIAVGINASIFAGGSQCMENTVEIRVTQTDIDIGSRSDCKYCPISLAAERALRCRVVVGGFGFQALSDSENFVWFRFPPEASNFVYDFDRMGKDSVKPFTFIARRTQ